MTDLLTQLETHLHEISDLEAVASVLEWDQEVMMPPRGVEARSQQLATLAAVIHQRKTDPALETWLATAGAAVVDQPADAYAPSLVRVARRNYEKDTRLPVALVTEIARVSALSFDAWDQARQAADYAAFKPWLGQMLDLTRQAAEHLGYEEHLYDAMLDLYEPGMRTRELETILAALRQELVPFVQAVLARADEVDDAPLKGYFPTAQQEAFGRLASEALGFRFDAGRLDVSAHPFCTTFAPTDVRLTTRYDEADVTNALFGVLHETGHGLYEQGIPSHLARTPLAGGASSGFHESQSRLWENQVGRSRAFWRHFYPRLQAVFPSLQATSLESFYRAINRVKADLIRVDADEVTYNLHIMLRFELEKDLLTGDLSLDDLPAAWNDKMQAYFGLRPPNDALGVLQDVHWSQGLFGYFPTYALGNLMAAQLYQQVLTDHPDLPNEFAAGRFDTVLNWMRQQVHVWGNSLYPDELLRRATGRPLTIDPYMTYLRQKYGEIYGL